MGISRKQQQQSPNSISFGVTKRAAAKGAWISTVGEIQVTMGGATRALSARVLFESEDIHEALLEVQNLQRLTVWGKFGYTMRPLTDAKGNVVYDEGGVPFMQPTFTMLEVSSFKLESFVDQEVHTLSDLDQLVQDQARLQAGLMARKAANTASSPEISEEEAAEAAAALAGI